ncbi:MAG TPA: hypothetical protein VFN80_02430 [Acidothermaceae bacterium]|nr:hypothetical protein [Acidothermaceae bacterium]
MYAALWRAIPGGLWGKLAGVFLLLLSALALLFFVIFPVVEPHLPWNDVTVNTPPAGSLPSILDSSSPTPSPSK